MLFFGLILPFGTALAMLSKPINPNSRLYAFWVESQKWADRIPTHPAPFKNDYAENLEKIKGALQDGVSEEQVHELLASVSTVLTSATSGTSASSKAIEFSSLMAKFAASFELFKLVDLESDESYDKTRERVCFVLGLTIDKLDDILVDLIVDIRARQFLVQIMACQFLRYIFANFYTCSEKDLPAFYWTLDHYKNIFEARMADTANGEAAEFWKAVYEPVPQFLVFFKQIVRKEPAFVPEAERIKRFPIVDWNGFLESIMRISKITKHAVTTFLQTSKYQIKTTNKVMSQMRKDFDLYIKRIGEQMEGQFPEQMPEDFISETAEDSVTVALDIAEEKHEEITRNENTDATTIMTLDEPSEKPEDVSSNSSSDSNSVIPRNFKFERKGKKQAKLEAREAKYKEKHLERVKQIRLTEKDDDDVAFYYTARNPEANLVFSRNQNNQICRQSFMPSKRYEHSIFPGLTASGATMNYLCSLMVSGNPDYEGFVAAHKDLGGIFVVKKNGNKLFLFKEPISYHKTLHAPHLSSNFDHILYRRFYRNCGLHPYFFINN